MPKIKGQSARDKEHAKTEKLLRKVGYTALKEAGIKSKRPSLPGRAGGQARAQLREQDSKADLKWSGGKAGT